MPEVRQHRADPRRPGRHHSNHRARRRAEEQGSAPPRTDTGDNTEPPGARDRHTQPLPVVPAALGRARHRSAPTTRRPVGRSLAGALAVLGVVGGVEMTAASLTGGQRSGTETGPAGDPATLSGLHAAAPQMTPTQPGPARSDDAHRDVADLPEPRRPADDRAGDRDGDPGADGSDGTADRTDRDGGGLRAGRPQLPDLPGLDLPGLLPGRGRANAANCGKPGRILDLSNWKLTLPTGSSGKPTEIVGSALSSLGNKHFGTASRCDAVAFRAPVNGATTKGSKNPRSELREMAGGSAKAGWSSSSGTHTMKVTEAFTRLPSGKPHLVGAQIHDASDDVTVFRLEGSKLWVTNGDNPNYKLADANYKLGTPFEAKYVVSGGQVRAFYNGKLVATIAKDFSGGYFKAGAYTQANCGNAPCSSDNYGETLIYDLDVTHT